MGSILGLRAEFFSLFLEDFQSPVLPTNKGLCNNYHERETEK